MKREFQVVECIFQFEHAARMVSLDVKEGIQVEYQVPMDRS